MSKPLAVLDTECYRNYWLCKIRRMDTGAVRVFEQYPGLPLDTVTLRQTLARVTAVTFNGINYDQPMISLALTGASCETLKRCSDFIIQGQMRPWDVERQFNFRRFDFDQIDLIEVVPGMVSLKVYMGRLHCRKLQDLPIEHDALIEPEQRPIIVAYNDNDLDGTAALYRKFVKQIDLRRKMSREYGIDLRSKSDAQIAEAVIRRRLTDLGIEVTKPGVKPRAFKLRFPRYLKSAGPIVAQLIDVVRDADFVINPKGYVEMPEALAKAKIVIGNGKYRMGIGGLHSSEHRQVVKADDEWLVVDRDVASYYPAIIINTDLYPKHLSSTFLSVYRGIHDERIAAKRRAGELKTIIAEMKTAGKAHSRESQELVVRQTTADTLKIVLNGSFGKFGNPWSILYSPDLLMQTTIIGQLTLLMLIEWIEMYGDATVVSANTDGIVIRCKRAHYAELEAIIKRWEEVTGFETEETRYKALYSRDVNAYIALKDGGGVKLKGAYAEPEPVASSWPSPHMQICVTAACDYLEHGIPLDMTVRMCDDIRQFIEVRNVTGGAMWRDQYLGRAVRWYYSHDGEPIFYRKENKTGGHNKVAGTDGCRPLMEMDGTMPADLDYARYVAEAEAILKDVGVA